MLNTFFVMKELGRPTKFLKLEPDYRAPRGIELRKRTLVNKLLASQGMEHARLVDSPMNSAHEFSDRGVEHMAAEAKTYRGIVGSILYRSTETRPDLCECTSDLRSFVERPGLNNMVAASRVLQYLRGTMMHTLLISPGRDTQLNAYVDAK